MESFQPKGDSRKMVIIGVGNLLLKDEGVGVHAARELKTGILPEGVEVLDGAVAGLGLLEFFGTADKIVLIDAVDMNLPPGTVVRFTPGELEAVGDGPKFSLHEVGLPEVLEIARLTDRHPAEVVIIGIQPKEISWGMDLTPEVQASIPEVMEAVRKEIEPGILL